MFELLSVLPENANGLWDLWDEAVPQLDEGGAEVYPFKDTLTSYYELDTAKLDEAPRRAAALTLPARPYPQTASCRTASARPSSQR